MTTGPRGKILLAFLIVVGVFGIAGARDLSGRQRSGPPQISEKTVWDGVYTADVHTITDIVTFLLQSNGLPDASRELPTDIDTLRQIAITRKPMGR